MQIWRWFTMEICRILIAICNQHNTSLENNVNNVMKNEWMALVEGWLWYQVKAYQYTFCKLIYPTVVMLLLWKQHQMYAYVCTSLQLAIRMGCCCTVLIYNMLIPFCDALGIKSKQRRYIMQVIIDIKEHLHKIYLLYQNPTWYPT